MADARLPGAKRAVKEGPVNAVRQAWVWSVGFFSERIWLARIDDLGTGRAWLYRVSRLLYSTVRGILAHGLTFRAAALTYFTLLSIVPFLAFAFSILKGLGGYERLLNGTIRPYLKETFGENPALYEAIDTILTYVDRTDATGLGNFGALILAYTSISLLSNIEQALNEIWGAKQKRPFVRQVTDYTTLLVTTPILILVALTMATAAQSSNVVLFLRESLHLGPVIEFSLKLTSIVVTCLAMIGLYILMPNVRTRVSSAIVGGVVAGLMWQAALVLHVDFQSGVARYNGLYSAMSALPIFLVWTYVSWLIVLVGAELAASHQNEQLVRQRLQTRQADQALKEMLAVAAAARVARAFLRGEPRPSAVSMAEEFEVPPLAMDEILEILTREGLVARTVCGTEVGYLPARDLDVVRVRDVQNALRHHTGNEDVERAVERQLGEGLRRVLVALEEEVTTSAHNLTLRALAGLLSGRAAAEPAPRDAAAPAPALDAKQPEVPA
jgi:membrane protein